MISFVANLQEWMTVTDRGAFRPWGFPLASWAFAIRIWIAAVVALYLSFWLELESPSSAILTVAILAEPTRGQVLEKAVFRLIATIVGVAASIAITGIFSQTRDLLLVAFAVWLGVCVYVAGLLDGNRAYAAVLSGYTVAFLAVQQIDDPVHVFESSMARGAGIVMGIISVAIVNDVLSAPDRHPALAARLADIHRRIRDCAKATINGEAIKSLASAGLIAEIVAIRPEMASLAVESISGPARSAAAQNAAIALIAEIHAVRALGVLPPIADGAARQRIVHALDPSGDEPAFTAVSERSGPQGNTFTAGPSSWALGEVKRRDEQVQLNLAALQNDIHPPWRWRSLLYRPHRTAAENGVRAAIWFGLAEAFLAYGGWPAASVSLSLVAVVIGLGAVTPNPLATTTLAFITAPVAGIFAGILEFFVLDGVSDFPLLAIALAPLLVGSALLITLPNRIVSVLGRLSLIFTVATFPPSNPQTYDAQSYVFSFLFVCIAMGLLLAAQLILPPVPTDRRRSRLMASARREFSQGPLWDTKYEPEEEMFRDAVRVGQFVSAGGNAPSDVETVEELLSHFDQSTAIRLCVDKLKAIGDDNLTFKVRAALNSRDPLELLNASQALLAISIEDPAVGDLGAALVVASRFIEKAPVRSDYLRKAA